MVAPRRNLELKARDRDPARSLSVCEELGAEDRGTLSQTDTYFEVPRGRLKLREEPGASAHLIAYERPNSAAHKESRYRIIPVVDPTELKEAFSSLLGLKATVRKHRRLFLLENVRIHLDQVESLGNFIELEAVTESEAEPNDFDPLLIDLRHSFQIADADLVRGSYCDLLQSQNEPSPSTRALNS